MEPTTQPDPKTETQADVLADTQTDPLSAAVTTNNEPQTETLSLIDKLKSGDQVDPQTMEILLELVSQKKAQPLKNSISDRIFEQLRQWGASTVASLIAITIAIISPVVINSQFAQDITSSISEIRGKLPNEADKLLMAQLTDLSKQNQNLISDINQKQQLLQVQSNDLKSGSQLFQQQYNDVINKVVELNLKNKGLETSSEKITQLEQKVAALTSHSVNTNIRFNQKLYQQITKLQKEGEKLTEKQSQQAEQWFKRTFYTVQGLQNQASNSQLKAHVDVLKDISNKDGKFNSFPQRKQETLLILSALSALVNAAVIR